MLAKLPAIHIVMLLNALSVRVAIHWFLIGGVGLRLGPLVANLTVCDTLETMQRQDVVPFCCAFA